MTFGRPLARQMMMTSYDVVGEPPKDPRNRTITEVHAASPTFFDVMGMLKRGRLYTEAENRRDGHQVLVINEELARRYFPSGDHIRLGRSRSERATTSRRSRVTRAICSEIVGIVGDVKQRGLSAELFPSVYLPYNVLPGGLNSIVVRTRASRVAIETAIRAQVREVDPRVAGDRTVDDGAGCVGLGCAAALLYDNARGCLRRFALVLAAIGIYGVISFTVSQRRPSWESVSRWCNARTCAWAGPRRGPCAHGWGRGDRVDRRVWSTRLISSMLFGVAPVDAVTFGGVAVTLIGIALLASWLPARRAAAVDPVIAMRSE